MTFRGHIRNGVAILDTPAALPDGTPVRIEVDRAPSAFWQNKTIEELAREQSIATVTEPSQLAGDWPPEDSIDEFLAFLREARH
jgi:hypothetical protein